MSVELLSALTSMKLPVPISSGTVTSPVAYVDITLPSGYSDFELHVAGMFYDDVNGNGLPVFLSVGGTWYYVAFISGVSLSDTSVGPLNSKCSVLQGTSIARATSMGFRSGSSSPDYRQASVAGAATVLRIVPVNNDFDPLQTSQFITAGTYSLLGVPV